jgi:hypothetical protein
MAGAFTYSGGSTGSTCTGGITQTTPGVDTDSATNVATKIRAAAYTGWTAGGSGAIVTFLKNAVGACSAPTLVDTDSTGVAASGGFTRTNQGVTTVWYNGDNTNWAAFDPTLAWATGTPASITEIARFKVTDKVCFFNVFIESADGNGATALDIPVPFAAKDNNSVISVSSQQLQNTTWTNPVAFLDDDEGHIGFRNFTTATSGQALTIIVSGFYEIA